MSRIEFDRDAGHADIARDAGVVAVVAAVGGEVEGDREALLPGREVAPIEGVAVLGGGEPGILPDRPGLGGVHGRIGAAQERRQARPSPQEVETRRCRPRCRAAAPGCPSGVIQASSSGAWPVSARKPRPRRPPRAAGAPRGTSAKLGILVMPRSPVSSACARSSSDSTSQPANTNSSTPAADHAARCASLGPAHQIDRRSSRACLRACAAASAHVGVDAVARADRGLPRAAGREGAADLLDATPAPRTRSAKPPASNRLRAKVSRAANCARPPRVAKNTRGRSPVRARIASLRVAQPLERRSARRYGGNRRGSTRRRRRRPASLRLPAAPRPRGRRTRTRR